MEHSPIQKLPTDLGSTFKEPEAVGVDELQRQCLSELRGAFRVLTIDANLELPLTVTGYTKAAMTTFGEFYLAKDRARRLLVLDDRLQPNAAE